MLNALRPESRDRPMVENAGKSLSVSFRSVENFRSQVLRKRAGYCNNLLFYSCTREALGPSSKSTQNKLYSCI